MHRSVGLGLLGVLGFSLTLPLTKVAVPTYGALEVTILRAVIAGAFAVTIVATAPGRLPSPRDVPGLVVVGLGTVIGFPLFAALSMGRVAASHGAVVLALVPLLTALAGSAFARERPTPRFWAASVVGTTVVFAFAFRRGSGAFAVADLLLGAGAASAAIGYAMGGVLAKRLGGTRVTCWSLIVCLPLTVPAAAYAFRHGLPAAPPGATLSVLYLALVSQLTAFFAWNRALATGGIAKVSQTQLLQCFFTLTGSAVILHERISTEMLFYAAAVVLCVFVGRSSPVRKGTSS